ncbi:Rho GTPase-activating protein 20 [Tupaia chinensis]|uniref:Rho GTPase-activating protein 20 n=1 Tax=Tupaia chinensis TaxID=246437 RepID=L9KJF9_TUPCH|nr:Rho GTPase-activating protein 20 [Tupaia chinensis]
MCGSESLSEVSTHSEKTTSQEDANYTLLIHGPVEFRRDQTRQKRHLFLFKNLLLVANTRSPSVNECMRCTLRKDRLLYSKIPRRTTAGHEHPYGIKTSHLQATALLPQGPECTTSPPTLQEPFLKQPSPDMEDQFILKARCPARGQQRNTEAAVNSAEGDSKAADLMANSLALDMLFILNQKGPLTEGIFRKSANIKSCRVLKEKLNSRVKVDMDSESVIVVASVFKVSFIQFLIENYLKIFGEDVTVSGESSPSCTNSEEDAGTLNN